MLMAQHTVFMQRKVTGMCVCGQQYLAKTEQQAQQQHHDQTLPAGLPMMWDKTEHGLMSGVVSGLFAPGRHEKPRYSSCQ